MSHEIKCDWCGRHISAPPMHPVWEVQNIIAYKEFGVDYTPLHFDSLKCLSEWAKNADN